MSANTAAITVSFKTEILTATHNLSSGGDSLKAALYLVASSIGIGTAAYTASGEVSGTNYSAGGVSVTNGVSPTNDGTKAYWTPSANIVYTSVTLSSTFDCCLIYNTSKSNKSICALTFPGQTVSAGTFTITMPTNGATSALLRVN
jgi:hypothetical protein